MTADAVAGDAVAADAVAADAVAADAVAAGFARWRGSFLSAMRFPAQH
jgi:hypothetical protein